MKAIGLAAALALTIGATSGAYAQGVAQPYQSPSYRAPAASSYGYGSPAGSTGVVPTAPLPVSPSAPSYSGGVGRTPVNPSSEYGTPIPGVTTNR